MVRSEGAERQYFESPLILAVRPSVRTYCCVHVYRRVAATPNYCTARTAVLARGTPGYILLYTRNIHCFAVQCYLLLYTVLPLLMSPCLPFTCHCCLVSIGNGVGSYTRFITLVVDCRLPTLHDMTPVSFVIVPPPCHYHGVPAASIGHLGQLIDPTHHLQ